MKRAVILGLVVSALVLAGVALARAEDSKPQPPYVVEPGTSSGADYQLTSLAWHAAPCSVPDGRTSGGRYRLLCPAVPGQRGSASSLATGSGCCCTYLPLVTGNLH